MSALKCGSCNKLLTIKTEIEYSQWLGEYFCDPDCATNHYFDHMQSTPFDPIDRKDELEERGIKIVNGKLYYI